jgi:hypothetical protein
MIHFFFKMSNTNFLKASGLFFIWGNLKNSSHAVDLLYDIVTKVKPQISA